MQHLFAICLGIILLGCSAPESSDSEEKVLKFIFITTVVGEDFFIPVKKGMEDAARLMGVNCTFTGTEGVNIPAQAAMVRQAIRDGYDGIALSIIDPEGFDDVINEAANAGIPAIAFNTDDHNTPNSRISSVCQRLYDAGKVLGKEAAKFIPDDSEILLTMHDKGISALEDRLHGIQDGLMEAGKKGLSWKVVISGSSVPASAEIIGSTLQAHPHIKYVLCTGQADTEGAGIAIGNHFEGLDHKSAGFDISPGILQDILQGNIEFTIDQQPYIQGYYPVIQLTLFKRYGIIPTSMDTGASLVTRENAESVLELANQHYR